MGKKKINIATQQEQKQGIEQMQEMERKHNRLCLFTEMIPMRFLTILVPEVIASILLYAMVKVKLVTGATYRPVHILVLLGFWALTYWQASRSRSRMLCASHYYTCNLVAYGLFLLVAAGAFLIGCQSEQYPLDSVYFPYFRVSYVIALLDDKRLTVEEIPLSVAIFYGVSLILIVIEPLVDKLFALLDGSEEWQK